MTFPAGMEPISLDPGGFCRYCGRPLDVVVEQAPGYDTHTGLRTHTAWMQCPRFARSWRNLWWGGWGHTSFQRENPILGRQYR